MYSNQSKIKQSGIFFYLLLLTFFLILLEISFFILCNKAYLSDFTFVSGQISLPVSIMPGVIFFLTVQLSIHFLYCLLVWCAAIFSGYLFKLTSNSTFNLSLMIWFMGIAAAFAANQFYYPNSRFTELSSLFLFSHTAAKIAAFVLTAGCITVLTTGLLGFVLWITIKSYNYTLLLMLFLTTAYYVAFSPSQAPSSSPLNSNAYPNVFIIGIDSLRPDFLGYFGADHATPFLDSLLNQSTVFSEAVTPLARTFPSWSSILLGQYPHESGIRSNLADTSNVILSESLPAIFKQHGYETIYATDETRFSNIDKHFGFNEIISPPIGLNDFLLGTFNDFPLSNLLINTSVGKWLFPYSYANRPAFVTYQPDSFIELMRPELQKQRSQPVLMAVHFCLPHHPYMWADFSGKALTPQERYQASIARVDQQIKTFIALLTASNLLDHAIVVLLSDHGEALELPNDRITQRETYLGRLTKAGEPPRFYPPSLDDEAINQSAGHGTDVLGLPQYHTLLAFKFYGMGSQHIGEVPGIVPLTDLKQTIMTLTTIDKAYDPLAAIVKGKAVPVPLQHVFIESDFSPEAIHTVYPETRKVVLEGIQLFQIDPVSTRLTVKDKMGQMIINSKQYADIYGDWMLALYPQSQQNYTSVLINLKTGQWTNDMHSDFALHSPALAMQTQLKNFYTAELAAR